MEDDAVVEAAVREGDEVAGGDRRQVGLDLEASWCPRSVAIVTVRVSPAASAAGWAVGHSAAAPTDAASAGGGTVRRRLRGSAVQRPSQGDDGEQRERTDGARDHAAASRAAGRSMAPDRSASPRMTPVGARVAHAAKAVEIADTAGDEDLGIVRPNERSHPLEVRVACRRGTARTARRRAPTSSPTSVSTVGGAAAATGTRRAAPGADRARPPASRRRPRGTRAGRRAGRRWPSSGRPGSRRPRTRAGSPRASRARRRAAAGRPSARRWRRPPRGWPARRVRAPSKSMRWISFAPCPTSRSTMRSGRSVGAPMPVDAPGQ